MSYEDHFDPEKDDPELRARLREVWGELGPRSRGPHVRQRLIGRRNAPIRECVRCGNALPAGSSKGRPRLYCSATCRKAAYEDRRAHRDGAVRVQLVDRVVVETHERMIRSDHPMQTCIDNVLDDTQVTWRLLREMSRRVGTRRIDPEDDAFWDLYGSVEFLHEAFVRAAE
ncbi:hypothetical protein [Protaetiibacter larvae]|uniref:Uncharacterized protein n=1 Tax=Protaetiibacter larvae TaxID=2592654 RepID=A0A5C1Y6R2_9MICO|nr:hypothetical protein [Protaetiibacter larvae]QEO09743.1 hypothetical protein FLP23_06830 [Protaetiibacter larvae]